MPDMQFGKRITTEKIVDGKVVSFTRTLEPSVKLMDDQGALTEFLKQLDLYKRGLIADFGIRCFVDRTTNKIYRVEPWYDNLKEME